MEITNEPETDLPSHFNELISVTKANNESSVCYGRIKGEGKPIKLNSALLKNSYISAWADDDIRADFDVEYVIVNELPYARTIFLTKIYDKED